MDDNVYITLNRNQGFLGWSKKHFRLMLVVAFIGLILVFAFGTIRQEVVYGLSTYEKNQQYYQLTQQRFLLSTIEGTQDGVVVEKKDGTKKGADAKEPAPKKGTESKEVVTDPFSYNANKKEAESEPIGEGAANEDLEVVEDIGAAEETGAVDMTLIMTDEQKGMLEAAEKAGVKGTMSDEELWALIPDTRTEIEPVLSGSFRVMLFMLAPISLIAVMTNRVLGRGSTLISEMIRIVRFNRSQKTYLYVHAISLNGR